MRDIEQYTQAYVQSDFETMMVCYRRKMMLESLAKYPHGAVLEIGCGMEPLFKYMDGVERWVIVEPSSLFCQQARACVPPEQNITIIEGHIEDAVTQLSAVYFDLIICSSLLHELEQPEIVLSAIHTLCGEDTVVHLNVPNALSLHRLLAVEMGLIDSPHQLSPTQQRLQQHQTYDMAQLCELAEGVGFNAIESGSYFPKLFTNEQLQKSLEHGVFNREVLDGMYRMIRYFPDYGAEIYLNLKKA